MFSFVLKTRRRIKKILKVKSESRQLPKPSVYSRTRKVALLLLASFLVGILYPGEYLYDPLDMPHKGEISREDVIAPSKITVYKSDRELSDEMEVIRLTVPSVVDCDTTVAARALTKLEYLYTIVDSVRQDSVSKPSEEEFFELVSAQFPRLSRDAISRSLSVDDPAVAHAVLRAILQSEIYKVGVLADGSGLSEMLSRNVLIRRGERENIYSRDRLLTASEANTRLLSSLNRRNQKDPIDVEYCYLVGRTFLRVNLSLNMDEYHLRLEDELNSVSNVKEVVEAGNVIVHSGTRINERQQRILDEMTRIMQLEAAERGWLVTLLPVLARILLVLAAFSSLYLFLFYFRREIFRSNPKLLALFLVFGLQLFLVYLAGLYDLSMYLFPIAVLSIIVTFLFDAEVGLISTLVLALLLGLMHRFDFTLTFMTMTVGTVACMTSLRVRKRTEFFKILLSVAATYAVFIFLVENLKFAPGEDVLTDVGFGLVNGAVSVLLTIGILPLFESLFGITTDITLLELSDMNHPLLKRLAVETPGTYQHSIIVGNLAEAAAKAIEANSLLARVGCYYHDIGKIEIPEYFVENQLSVKSKHDDLTPSASAMILSSHVKRGRKLGEEADIPDDVLNFVEEHHGTMMMSFFYNKAIEQGADESVANKFRYPGPKPQIRETGIAMLADAVEAASRTLDDPKPARTRNLIQRIINDRFQSGELDECPLTLRDLAKIRDAFAQWLTAAFHRRVVYPKRAADEGEEEE
ncbi:MAG: HDIG domain-containing protein [candidate division Zixibacteria bacterium]|nr:HDIG domain-containing protein [candidate division Zixibacteria bacterium]